jgi:hypothetical protein
MDIFCWIGLDCYRDGHGHLLGGFAITQIEAYNDVATKAGHLAFAYVA